MVLDILREYVAGIGKETFAKGPVGAGSMNVLYPEEKADTEENKHCGKAQKLRCHKRASGLLHVFAGKLPLDELLVRGKLRYLEYGNSYEASDDSIWFAEINRRVEHLHLAT